MFTDDRTALIISSAVYTIQIIYTNCVYVVVTKIRFFLLFILLSFLIFHSLIGYFFLETSAIGSNL